MKAQEARGDRTSPEPTREEDEDLIRVLDKTNTCLREAADELENLSGADLQRDLQRDVQSLREKYNQRAAIIKKLRKSVRNEGTTTAVESSSDT